MAKLIDLVNQRFGFWIVKFQGVNSSSGQTQWNCLCECGVEKLVSSNSLRTGNSTSCGCNHAPDLLGRVFGELTVSLQDHSKGSNRRYWMCDCSCGSSIILDTDHLLNKHTETCKHHTAIKKVKRKMKNVINELNALRSCIELELTLRGAATVEFNNGNVSGAMSLAHQQSIQNVITAAKILIEQSAA